MNIGGIIQKGIHIWLNVTGRKVDVTQYPFLDGPMSADNEIGDDFYKKLACTEELSINESSSSKGLLSNFDEVIDKNHEFRSQLHPEISKFYEQTSLYSMEVWSKWNSPMSWFAKLLIQLVSVNIKQLNIPTDALETSYGMDSSVIQLLNKNKILKYTCWLRKSVKTNRVVYAGFYSAFQLGEQPFKHIRVVFPLPQGNVTVILKVNVMNDGSVKLISNGTQFGATGYYRVHKNKQGIVKFRKIPIKETIHVYKDKFGVLRTDHYFKFWKMKLLQLHYKMVLK